MIIIAVAMRKIPILLRETFTQGQLPLGSEWRMQALYGRGRSQQP